MNNPKKVLLVHGVHNGTGYDYSHEAMAAALNIPSQNLTRFSWASTLDRSKLDVRQWLGDNLIKALGNFTKWGDFIDDVASYLLDQATRKRCIESLRLEIAATRPDVIIGHSLGSVLVWECLQKHEHDLPCKPTFIIAGSPLWFGSLRWWLNIRELNTTTRLYAGWLDPIAGFRTSRFTGIDEVQGLFNVGHDLLAYLKNIRL